jgi:membrane associated rhomboid family serine protease
MMNKPEDFLVLLHSMALFNPYVVAGEYWRLFSSMFMHWGIIHLAVNMYALYSIGRELEPVMGKARFALLYFATGIAGGLASLFFNLYAISVGASGAIFGLYGFMIMWQVLANFRNRQQLTNILINFLIFVVINYAIAQSANVDTPAHIGGFLMGVSLSLLNFLGLLIPVFQWALLVAALPFLILGVPETQLKYYNIFQTVVQSDGDISRIYNQMLTDEQRADSLSFVKPHWDSAAEQLKVLGRVPTKLASDTTTLSHYITYRAAEVD